MNELNVNPAQSIPQQQSLHSSSESHSFGSVDALASQEASTARPASASTINDERASSLLQRSVSALSNSAPVSTLCSSVQSALPLHQIRQTMKHPLPGFTDRTSQLRDLLQGSIVRLERPRSTANRSQMQELAHRRLIDYSNHAGTLGDRVIPTLNEAFQSCMYNLMFFGMFRGGGETAASVLHQHMNNQPLQLGYYADSNSPSQTGEQALTEHALRLFIGSFTGALGDMTASHGIAPFFNAVGRQIKPVPTEVLVPDRTRDLMNQLEPGSGDELRRKIDSQKFELSHGASGSNISIAQNIFTGFWTLKNAVHPGPFGAMGNMVQLGLGTAIPGSIVGATVAMNKMYGTAEVPDLEALENALVDGSSLSELPTHSVALFYTEHAEDTTYMERVMESYKNDPLLDPAPEQNVDHELHSANNYRAMSTASNVVGTVAHRAISLGQATFPGTALFAAMGPVSNSVSNGQLRTLINVAFNGLALFSIVQNWSKSVTLVPEQEKALHERRQIAVNASASDQPTELDSLSDAESTSTGDRVGELERNMFSIHENSTRDNGYSRLTQSRNVV